MGNGFSPGPPFLGFGWPQQCSKPTRAQDPSRKILRRSHRTQRSVSRGWSFSGPSHLSSLSDPLSPCKRPCTSHSRISYVPHTCGLGLPCSGSHS